MKKREFIQQLGITIGGVSMLPIQLSGKPNTMNLITQPTNGPELIREASHYQSTPRGVKCLICPNECTLKDGELSDCHNRKADKGKLYTMAYGNPCAIHVDPVEKKPLLHFLPQSLSFSIATAGCNFACLNCQNWEISQTSPTETRNQQAPPLSVVETALREKCQSIAFTYSEPITFFEYMLDTATLAHEKGVKTIMVSNGYINPDPLKELCQVIDAANIDLKVFDEEIYLKLTGGKLEPILKGLTIFRDQGVWLEITNLMIPSWTDNMQHVEKMCKWLADEGFSDYPLHFSRFHPQYKLTRLPATPVSTLEKARDIAQKAGLKYVYIGNLPGIGGEDTWCPGCKKLLIRRRGFTVEQNRLEKGQCPDCKTSIAGVWTL